MPSKARIDDAHDTLPAPATASKALERQAAAHEALCRFFKKGYTRDSLTGGADYDIDLAVRGKINKRPFEADCIGTLHVAHDHESSASTGPQEADLLAVVLAKLARRTREKLLATIVEEYAANGNQLPEVDKLIAAQADAALQSMRASRTVTKRGDVKFSPAAPVLA